MKKLVSLFCIFSSLSLSAHSALVTHFGYTLNTETNIVTGDGLEWLKWDKNTTDGVYDVYNDPTWRLPTSTEVIRMLDAFSPVSISAALTNSNSFSFSAPYAEGNDGFVDSLIEIMGDTYYGFIYDDNGDLAVGDDIVSSTGALFSHIDEYGDELYGSVLMFSDYSSWNGFSPSTFSINLDIVPSNIKAVGGDAVTDYVNELTRNADQLTVARVRNLQFKSVPELNASIAPISLLLLGALLCLGVECRRKYRNS